MPDVLAERAAIESSIADLTLPRTLERVVAEYGDGPAYSDKVGVEGAGWRTVTWAGYRDQVLCVAAALRRRGLRPGDTLAIMASSRIEHVVADMAAVHAGATPTSVYATLAPEQVAYVAAHATPSVVVLEGADQLARWEAALDAPSIRTVVVLDGSAVPADDRFVAWSDLLAEDGADDVAGLEQVWRSVEPSDPVTILYTSGTTGHPKGVVLTHRNVLFEAHSSLRTAAPEGELVWVSYLPLAHIAERLLGMYVPQVMGGHVHLVADPAALLPALVEVHPTRFFGVPRVWEKIKTGLGARLAAEPDEARRQAVADAMALGREYVESLQTGSSPTPELTARFDQVDRLVLAPIRGLLGLDRVEWATSAAAPMPIEVARFFAGLGMRIYDVYGMTETTAAVTAGGPGQFRLGTVGKPLAGIEVRLADDGEILARGPVATPGYFRQDDATRELVDEDGWVHTGDIGELDDDGFLRVVDRKKEMIITSSGKNIAPSNIENLLKESPVVGHALVFGEARPYCVAVLTLDPEVTPVVARQLGLGDLSLAELAQHPVILRLAQDAVDAANARLSRPEQVKAFELLPVEWTAESEELTPTLKLKRRVVHQKYADVLDRLYG
ncbi:MAG TPA: AMP-binding protein [Nocardioides sp.]|nr:AMP-binding protein [Nocardioides sp.]